MLKFLLKKGRESVSWEFRLEEIYCLLTSGVYFYSSEDQEKFLREIKVFISPAPDFFREAEFSVKVYVGGKRLYGVEIESIVEEFYLERVA